MPHPLAALYDDGTLTQVRVEPASIVTTLHTGRNWSRDGARVRSALHAALADQTGWAPADKLGEPDDGQLRCAAQALLDGPIGDLAHSLGGHIELVDVRDGTVTVELAGACHGCPAARTTLRRGLEDNSVGAILICAPSRRRQTLLTRTAAQREATGTRG
ncbi:NifU family protein [Micromonospora sp. 067-2]|uniref:NifU family protein n=1 Tax=Micromonospora sp. 067-2 TaxID=2789270 RepID=UPI00397A94D5